METHGKAAERLVVERVRAALVVVLVELPTDGDRLDELLYVGLTRATTELVVIAPPELAGRLA